MAGVVSTIQNIVYGSQVIYDRKKLHKNIFIRRGQLGEPYLYKVYYNSTGNYYNEEKTVLAFYRDGYIYFNSNSIYYPYPRIYLSISRWLWDSFNSVKDNLFIIKQVDKTKELGTRFSTVSSGESLQEFLERSLQNA